MFRQKNGTYAARQIVSGDHAVNRVSEAERLRARGEALRHSRYADKKGVTVRRNREEEQKRSEELKQRSGSRYPDKQGKAGETARVSPSRYKDKRTSEEENARAGSSRYADKQVSKGKKISKGAAAAERARLRTEKKAAAARKQAEKEAAAVREQAEKETAAVSEQAEKEAAVKNQADKEASREEKRAERKARREEQKKQYEEMLAAMPEGNFLTHWFWRIRHGDSLAIALMAVVVVFLAGYSIVGVFYSSHFYSGTSILGIPCGKLTAGQAKEAVSSRIGEYSLKIDGRSGSETVTAAQAGFQYHDVGGIEQLLASQKSYFWPVMMYLRRNTVLEVGTEYDAGKVDGILDNMECFRQENVEQPADAYLGSDETGFIVVPEKMGTLPDREAVKSVLMDALEQGRTEISLEDNDCYVKPNVYSDDPDLNAQAEERNSLLGANITYEFGGRTEVVDTEVLMSFMEEREDGTHFISADHIYEYVAGLAEKYDTYGGYRSFHTTIGTTVDLYGGDYGWLINQEATADELAEMIRQKKVCSAEPVYDFTAMSRGLSDIGGTYVEICISMQEMWCYQDGVLVVDTPVVTGNPNSNHATPSGGVWAIDAKMRDTVLVGADYRAPVSYWMPFNGGVGIHDLQARYYFGGTIYLYNGSHGCVNTPMDAVSAIYDIVSVGTPVIIYE